MLRERPMTTSSPGLRQAVSERRLEDVALHHLRARRDALLQVFGSAGETAHVLTTLLEHIRAVIDTNGGTLTIGHTTELLLAVRH